MRMNRLCRVRCRRYEAHHGVAFTDAALDAAVACAGAYSSGRRLPDSAIDLMDEAAALRRMRPAAHDTSAQDQHASWELRSGLQGPTQTRQSSPPAGSMEADDAGAARNRNADAPVNSAGEQLRQKRIVNHADDSGVKAREPAAQPSKAFAARRQQAEQTARGQAQQAGRRQRWPKQCPHSGFAVTDAPSATLLCPDCLTLFLNVSPDKLMLGTSAVPMHMRPSMLRPGSSSSGAPVATTGMHHTAAAPSAAAPLQSPEQLTAHALKHAEQRDRRAQRGGHLCEPVESAQKAHSELEQLVAEAILRDQRSSGAVDIQAVGSDNAATGGMPPHASSHAREAPNSTSSMTSALPSVWVNEDDVLEVVAAEAGLPLGQLRADAEWFQGLRSALQAAVWGQDDAISCVVLHAVSSMLLLLLFVVLPSGI